MIFNGLTNNVLCGNCKWFLVDNTVNWFHCADYRSLSSGSESSAGETDSEDERTALAQNKSRGVAAAQVAQAQPQQPQAQALQENGAQPGSKKKSGRSASVVHVNTITAGTPSMAPPAMTTQPQSSTRRASKRTANVGLDPVAMAEAMGKSMGACLNDTLKQFVIPKKARVEKPEEDEDLEEEETVLVEENMFIRDNSLDTLDLALRSKIRVPNAAADTWWSKNWISQRTTHPIRGASLFLEDLQGSSRPNDVSIMKVSKDAWRHLWKVF